MVPGAFVRAPLSGVMRVSQNTKALFRKANRTLLKCTENSKSNKKKIKCIISEFSHYLALSSELDPQHQNTYRGIMCLVQ